MIDKYYKVIISDVLRFIREECPKLNISISYLTKPSNSDVGFMEYFPLIKMSKIIKNKSVNVNVYRYKEKYTIEACSIIATCNMVLDKVVSTVAGRDSIAGQIDAIYRILTEEDLLYALEYISSEVLCPELDSNDIAEYNSYSILAQYLIFNLLYYKYRIELSEEDALKYPSRLLMLYSNIILQTLDTNMIFTQEIAGFTKMITYKSYKALKDVNILLCKKYLDNIKKPQ